MNPFVADPDFTLYVGDVRDVLRDLPDESVHCVVTSPPYWNLRDYGTGEWEGGYPDCDHMEDLRASSLNRGFNERWGNAPGARKQEERAKRPFTDVCGKCGAGRVDRQIGLEASPAEYVAGIVDVFREVRRVLRSDGTCWLNLGDSYNAYNGNRGETPSTLEGRRQHVVGRPRVPTGSGLTSPGLKSKDLVGIPWRVAFGLQEDGWYLRSDIVWSKPNPMPESVTDRPTKSHEYVFLLTKSGRYFYDVDAIREPHSPDGRRKTVHDHATDDSHPNYDNIGHGQERWPNGGRNKRTVWTIATESYKDAHFATFPQALVEPCVKAGTSEHGCCSDCGAPWKRIVEVEYDPAGRTTNGPRSNERKHREYGTAGFEQRLERSTRTIGWEPSCEHYARDGDEEHRRIGDADERLTAAPNGSPGPTTIPCVVLDPFMGSGTTALVVRRLGRRSVGIELNPEYADLAAKRLSQLSLFGEQAA